MERLIHTVGEIDPPAQNKSFANRIKHIVADGFSPVSKVTGISLLNQEFAKLPQDEAEAIVTRAARLNGTWIQVNLSTTPDISLIFESIHSQQALENPETCDAIRTLLPTYPTPFAKPFYVISLVTRNLEPLRSTVYGDTPSMVVDKKGVVHDIANFYVFDELGTGAKVEHIKALPWTREDAEEFLVEMHLAEEGAKLFEVDQEMSENSSRVVPLGEDDTKLVHTLLTRIEAGDVAMNVRL